MREHRYEEYWSSCARSYDRDGEYVVGRPVLQAIENIMRQEQGLGRVVEFGCGTGYWTKAIAGHAQYVVATDLSGEMLEVAQEQLVGFDDVWIQEADCARAPYARGGFDCVLMANLLHVIDHPSRCLQEAHRILRGGGLLVAVDLTSFGMKASRRVGLGLRYLITWGLPPRRGRDSMSPAELVSLVEGVGFTAEDVRLIEAGSNAVYLKARKGQTPSGLVRRSMGLGW
jgi:ABC-2 type transport system ATP-binding protein